MLRVRTIQWNGKWPQVWSKWRALRALQAAGADTSKCELHFDWWEVEWPK